MKSPSTLILVLSLPISPSALAGGGSMIGNHVSPHLDCIGGRFSHICVHHRAEKSEGARDTSPTAWPKACKKLESTAPRDKQLTVRIFAGADAINVATPSYNQTYSIDESESTKNRAVYTLPSFRPEGAPESIAITDLDDSAGDSVRITIEWNRYSESLECPAPEMN